MSETILQPSLNRFILYPIAYNDVWEFYKKSVASFWTPEEIDLEVDCKDWVNLKEEERHFIKTILAFFAASDGIVNENIVTNFYNAVQVPEMRAFYSFQIAMEQIHAETYSLLLQTLVTDENEKTMLFHAAENHSSIKNKADWALNYLNDNSCFATKLVAYACVEGILFSGSFCALFYMKKRGLMPGLTFSNELISRDEGLHAQFACLVYSKLNQKLNQEDVYEIVSGAVNLENSFICEALPCSIIGMSSEKMFTYIKYVADRLLVQLGCDKLYDVGNPFDFMDLISLQGKTNFFEKRVSEYQKSGVMNSLNSLTSSSFSTCEDF
ncbi:MAG: ribonucleoside-diphosphate reductase [Euryarchaeota archaeon]|nr:ribonucleoside-diphosphate reductase [Euryarchaeota archaeon]|tara:strand:- start:2021 stop:2995 length:975 start_codon:yes stop_codon:yes gene_type:complete